MSYQVLARKWRPASFDSLVGQSHVVRALSNALDQERLHHAYLLTGTRGVGKTTLGRILAKCLNCERGITSTPCNTCQSCTEIASGRFIDLIEVDAASRTKVEDTRELLENVPYAPTTGRFKVYLIDEVHMLSTHSFNALLKTLEEPPPHVKFFLATTDPQKLPITVLSRCLQFHLKCLSPEQISLRLAYILQQENIPYEEEALARLARAAEGSMRDALSLLDQAIAFGEGKVNAADIKAMLSSIEATYLYEIVEALSHQDGTQLIKITHDLAENAADFGNVLEELLSLLHQIALKQFIKELHCAHWDETKVSQYATQFSPEDIQLFYQIGLIGRKDLPLAPTARIGLEMVLLRMLAFRPDSLPITHPQSTPIPIRNPEPTSRPNNPAPLTSPPSSEVKAPEAPEASDQWQAIVQKLNLTGMTAAIAKHCILAKMTETEVNLILDPAQSILLNKKQEERLSQALEAYFQRPINLVIQCGQISVDTPAMLEQQAKTRQLEATKEAMHQDPNVKNLMTTFNAKLLTDTIEPNN